MLKGKCLCEGVESNRCGTWSWFEIADDAEQFVEWPFDPMRYFKTAE